MGLFTNPLIYMLAIVIGIFIALLVILFLKSHGEEKDTFQNRLDRISGKKSSVDYLDEDMNKSFSERILKPIGNKLYGGIRKISQQNNTEESVNDLRTARLNRNLRQAGTKMSANEFRTMRLLIVIGSVFVLGVIAFIFSRSLLYAILFAFMGAMVAYVAIRFILSSKVTSRKVKMQSQLPEVLDMLSVSVEAGLGLEQAMIEVVKHFDGPIIDEIAISNREMAMGRSRNDALVLLGERCDIDEVQSFTRAIIQATEMGIAVKNVLSSQAEYMRQTHKNKVEEKAMKISVKILIPMAIFILPVIIIVLLGPAILRVTSML